MRTISQLLLTFLLNACWQIALVTAVAAICARLLRRTSARYQHLLWVTALAFSFSLTVLTCAPIVVGAFFFEPPQTIVQTSSGGFVPTPQLTLDTQEPLPTALKETTPFILINRNAAVVVVALYLLFLCYRGGKLSMAWGRARSAIFPGG